MIALRTAACAISIGLALIVAATAQASPAPEEAESDCAWSSHGITIVVAGVEYRCLCAMLTGPAGKRVLCRLYRVDKLPREPKRKLPKKPTPKKPPKTISAVSPVPA